MHDTLVLKVARRLASNGYFIEADLPEQYGYPKPRMLGSFYPDILASKPGLPVLAYEIETGETIDSQHTVDQLRTFSAITTTGLVVPKSEELRALVKVVLSNLNVEVIGIE